MTNIRAFFRKRTTTKRVCTFSFLTQKETINCLINIKPLCLSAAFLRVYIIFSISLLIFNSYGIFLIPPPLPLLPSFHIPTFFSTFSSLSFFVFFRLFFPLPTLLSSFFSLSPSFSPFFPLSLSLSSSVSLPLSLCCHLFLN